MADTKITSLLTPQVTTNPATDVLPIVNIADTSMASSGSTRKITVNTLLGAGGTATLASATITGDLTVDTSTLKVDSANNRVGIGTASPNNTLTVRGSQDAGIEINSADSNMSRIITAYDPANTRFYINSTNSGSGTVLPLDFLIGNAAQYRIAASGVFTWYDGAGSTRMTLNSTGNLVFPSAKGIDFSAVTGGTGTATGNVLNDYEEGTWTATLRGSVSDPTAVTATGRYTKVGRQVTVQVYFSNVVTTGASGRIGISGLPFANNGSTETVGAVGLYDIATFTGSPFAQVGFNATQVDLYSSVSNSVWQAVTHNAGNARYLWFNMTYTV